MSFEYLQNDDELIRLRNEKRRIDAEIKRLEIRQEQIKAQMIEEYLEHGVLPEQDMLHIRKVPPAVVVTDETKIPDRFFKIERKLDKRALNEAFKSGETIDGVTLDNGGYTIAIRNQ